MHVYVQQIGINKGTRAHQVLLDFSTLDDHLGLASDLGGQVPLTTQAAASHEASMLSFSYRPSGSQGLKEGSWYDLDPAVFEQTQYQPVHPDSGGASFLRANLIGAPMDLDFTQFLVEPQVADIPSSSLNLDTKPHTNGPVELHVVDCGHGNWNEVVTPDHRLIYDVGAGRQYTKAQVRNLIAGRGLASETRPITVIISHWDVDHYHALLEFAPSELAKLQSVFTPSQVPNTATYQRVAKRLADHGVPLTALPPAPRSGTSRDITLKVHRQGSLFTVFRATPGRSRNQTGIVLGVKGPNTIALLTGDHHYNKVLDAAKMVPAYRQRPCVLVAPHHGGLAGNPLASDWLGFFSSLTVPISCGLNPYGHPVSAVQTELQRMQAGQALFRTDARGTWTHAL